MDATQALVLMDGLLETGEATWPGVGRFVLVISEARPRANAAPDIVDFPLRQVEFHPDPRVLEQVRERASFPGFGTFVVRNGVVGFQSDPGLRARLVKTPAARFVPASVPAPSSPAPVQELPRKSWWQRLFS